MLCALVCHLFPNGTRAQQYVNREWVQVNGMPDALDWTSTAFDALGNIITVGNTLIAPGNPDILIAKHNRSGELVWQQNYGGVAGAQDYGVAVATDQNGNVYVSGVVATTNNLFDVVVLKYNSAGGLLWSQQWNGPANLSDAPSSMVLATDGSIYVSGTTYAAPANTDYLLLKYSNNGLLQWASTYDHNGLADVATNVILHDGQPIVTGGSASTVDAWDYATVKFAPTDGAQLDENRVNVPGLGLDNALAFTRDNAGNLLITGYREVNGTRDIQTVKLNTAFTVDWVRTFDGAGLHDWAKAVDTDLSGNVYVAGTTKKANGGSDFITIKYGPDGTELWRRRYKANQEEWTAEANKAAVTNDGGVIVVGSVFDGTSHNFKTVKYSATGQLEWQEEYDGLSGNDKALDLLVDSDGKVYVSGTSGTGSGNTYTTVKYAYTTLQNGNHILGDGTALCKSGELLVKFRSRYVYTNVVDDTKWQFGTLDQLVPTPIANAIGDALGLPSGTGGRIKTYKVFRNLTTADSISITRLGDEERIPSFWSTFLLEVDLTAEPMSVVDAVNEVTQYLEYAQLNYLYKPLSDPLYPTRQQSLTPSAQYPTGDINIEPAWTITTGRPEVKVGVVDELIEYWHPEFMMAGSMASKIIYGFSYFYNEEMTDVLGPDLSNSYPHGTACAGVIGAIRNNEEGIAGIAGGDADLGEYGCSLISLGIFNAENIATTSFVANALLEGSLDLNASGNSFACHVLNNSWGANGFQAFDQEIRKAAYQVYRNECVFVAAKGNGGNPPHYPADYGPEWSKISVGASGWDGSLMTLGNGGYAVTYGGSMDLIAPGAQEMITSTVGQYVNFPFWAECAPLPARYSCFRASSSAAAHASGVAALMLSEHNVLSGYANGLAPEDVEQIMEKGATDISGPPWNNPNYTAGFDPYNGWGRLNAGESVRLVHTPYRVFHSGTPQLSTVSGQQQTINVYSNVGWNNTWDLDEGLHTVVPITVTHTYVNDFGPNTTVLDGLGGQPGYWPRHSSTVGLLEFMGEQTATWDFELVGNVLYVTATTMCFKVITQPNGEPINRFIPAPAEQLRTPYSVHLLDEFTVGQNESEHAVQLSVYPNPANDMVNISWQDLHPDKLVVYDARGRVVADVMLGSFPKVVTLSTGGWSPGLYTVMVSSPAGRAAQRFQKH